jgi:lysylphosphatidylglycerol synthetase-like protein (DUF2156 family)
VGNATAKGRSLAVQWRTASQRRRGTLLESAFLSCRTDDLFCGLVTFGFIALHLVAVVGRAVSGRGFGGEARFAYDFRFYSLVLMGVVIIIPGLVCLIHARRLTRGDVKAWTRTLWASSMLLLISVPLVPIQAFAIGPAGLAGLNLVALWAGRKQFRIAELTDTRDPKCCTAD